MDYNPIAHGQFVSGLRPIKSKSHRKRWVDDDENIYEWDSRHCELERHDSHGKHSGVVDPESGERIRPSIPGRWIEV